MTVKEREQDARIITRELLMNAFDDPGIIIAMTIDCTKPEDVENQVTMIMEYLDKTDPEKNAESATIVCPDCGLEIRYDVNKLGAVVETWVPGACPRCGACLK